jgi:phenylacetate-coenzyme A ligase PaaK-like adenylate-forming protein
VLMRNPAVGGNWQMVLSTEDDIDQLTVVVETKERLSQVDSGLLGSLLQKAIQAVIVFTPRVEVLAPNSIPETGLKAKRVLDNRRKA